MAKQDSLITLRGTVAGLTFVKSFRYGDHVRRARGTVKKAKLNKAFKAQSQKIVKTNVVARILLYALNPHREDFKYGQLWQELVSIVNKASSDQKGATFDFSTLKPFDLHPEYPLDRLINYHVSTSVDRNSSKLSVSLTPDTRAVFYEPVQFLDGYRTGVLVLFPELKKRIAKTGMIYSDIIPLTDKPAPLHVEFAIPPRAKTFLLFVRIDGCENGEVSDSFAAKGMRMVMAGKI